MRPIASIAAAVLTISTAAAQEAAFTPGEVMPGFGQVAEVETDFEVPEGMLLKLSFDVAASPDEGINNGIGKVARFINMHGQGGIDPQPLDLAIVIHGPAVYDVTQAGKDGGANESAKLVEALLEQGVRVIVCGQSAAYQGVEVSDLIDGVEMALSAMTAHAVLQGQGYAINPF